MQTPKKAVNKKKGMVLRIKGSFTDVLKIATKGNPKPKGKAKGK